MISVCIATHNGAHFIRQQMTSILCQLSEMDEVIVSDDGSTDDTLEILASMNDKRIRIFNYTQPTKTSHAHIYVSRNFANALSHANGDYIFLADQDDIWLPSKVEQCVKALVKYDLVVHEFEMADANCRSTGRFKYNGSFRLRNLTFYGTGKYYGCAMAFRKSLLKHILPFPKNLVVHDTWIGIIAEIVGNVGFISNSLMRYRVFPQSVSHSVNNSFFFSIFYRLHVWFYLIKRFNFKLVKLL